jgi:hypothetical protein
VEIGVHDTNCVSDLAYVGNVWKPRPVLEVKCDKKFLASDVFDLVHRAYPGRYFYDLGQSTPVNFGLENESFLIVEVEIHIVVVWKTEEGRKLRLRKNL